MNVSDSLGQNFLQGLRRARGNVQIAAGLCGRTRQWAYLLRSQKPDFRRAWDTIVSQVSRQHIFLTALRKSRDVNEAAHRAGRGKSWAYRLRSQDPDFRRAWEEACA